MKRKNFLSALLGAPLISQISAHQPVAPASFPGSIPVSPAPFVIPPYLKAGDTIGITCPAGFMEPEELAPALAILKDWGFLVRIGFTVGRKDFSFGGTDTERAEDLQQMMDDPGISAIMCARGGYGVVRIIDRLDFRKFVARPKWIIGFSDVTVLHAHLNHNYGIASIHSKMCNSFPPSLATIPPEQRDSILSIRTVLGGGRPVYPVLYDAGNKAGSGRGMLTGGNLKMIETLAGTGSDLRTDGMILFLEDTGEYLYSIDRMFYNLKRTGKLKNLAGLIVGGFKIKADDAGDEFGRSIYNIVLDQVSEYKYPVCFNFPVGHQLANYALKCGVVHELNINAGRVSLKEI